MNTTRVLYGVLAPFFILITGLSTSCEHEQETVFQGIPLTRTLTAADIPTDFFAYSDTLHLSYIVPALQTVDSIAPFVADFKEDYGMPLWNFAFINEGEEESCYFIPVWSSNDSKKISKVWVFGITEEQISYAPFRYEDNPDNSDWKFLFDLLTYYVFGMDNDLGVALQAVAQTREWITISSCWDVYAHTELTGWIYKYRNCIDRVYWIDASSNTGGHGGTGAGTLPGEVIGGGASGNSGSNENTSFQAKDIFENNNFMESNWKVLDLILEEITDDCMGQQLYNGISNALDGDKISIQIVDSSNPGYDWTQGVFTLNVEYLTSDVFFHELFHLYQTMQEMPYSFETSLLNREIEAHYAQFIYLQKPTWSDEEYRSKFESSPRGASMKFLHSVLDESGNIKEKSLESMLNIIITEYVLKAFRKNETYNSYSFNIENNGVEIFQNLNKLTKGCK